MLTLPVVPIVITEVPALSAEPTLRVSDFPAAKVKFALFVEKTEGVVIEPKTVGEQQ